MSHSISHRRNNRAPSIGLLRLRRRRTPGHQSGQALIEFVPIVLVLLTLVFGVIDMSRAIWQQEVLGSLSREGSDLASRDLSTTPCMDSAKIVVTDGSNVNLSKSGTVIVTQVENVGGKYIIEQQAIVTSVGLAATSRVGTGVGKLAILPAVTPALPLPNQYVYVTEVFSAYSPITPIGSLVSLALPSTLYDVAYF